MPSQIHSYDPFFGPDVRAHVLEQEIILQKSHAFFVYYF